MLSYDGRPTNAQVERTEVLARELEDVIKQFQQLTSEQLPGINSALTQKKLAPIQVVSEADWQKAHQGGGTSKVSGLQVREID